MSSVYPLEAGRWIILSFPSLIGSWSLCQMMTQHYLKDIAPCPEMNINHVPQFASLCFSRVFSNFQASACVAQGMGVYSIQECVWIQQWFSLLPYDQLKLWPLGEQRNGYQFDLIWSLIFVSIYTAASNGYAFYVFISLKHPNSYKCSFAWFTMTE